MRLFYVDHFEYEYARSLIPPKEPEPKEKVPIKDAMVTPMAKDLIALFIRLGYTPEQARLLYEALLTHYWYDFGLRNVHKCNEMIYYWQKSYLAPAWTQVKQNPCPWLTGPVMIFGAILTAVVVVLVIKGPTTEKDYWWYPPGNLYLGTYKEQLWWIALVAVSGNQKPMYAMTGYEGNVITAYSYDKSTFEGWKDRVSFWGTMDFRCWKVPYFRSYRLQSAICYYIGRLESAGGMYFYLTPPAVDRFAPRGPMTIPKEDWCRDYSPCHV